MDVVRHQNRVYNEFRFQNKDIAEKVFRVITFLRDEFIYGGHWISLGASCLVLSTMLFLGISIRWEFLLIAYLSGMIIYGYDRYRDIAVDSSDNCNRTNHLKRCYPALPFLLTGYGVAFFALLAYFGNVESVLFGGLLVIIGVLYTHRLKKLTRKIVGFKNYYTAFSVATLVIFTALFCSYQLNWALLILFVYLFLRMFVDCSFCDIKDMDEDRKNKLLTFPVVLGKDRFLTILHLMNILACFPIIIGVVLHVLPLFSLIILISSFYSFYFIQKARNVQTDIRSLVSHVVDGEFAVWPLLLFIGGILI
jgi:4-hydroxybenzoate polyprenyltransferase